MSTVTVRLAGCPPEPLHSYLKAVAVLRLVAEQVDPEALGWWERDIFHLRSRLDADGLVAFFAERYAPSPLVTPWNKDFHRRKDSPVERLLAAPPPVADRLTRYRQAMAVVREVLPRGFADDAEKSRKIRLLAEFRRRWPEDAVRWLDAIVILAGFQDTKVAPAYAPLFISGGADGRFEFGFVFAQSLAAVLLDDDAERRVEAVRAALFGELHPEVTTDQTAGPLLPPGIEGPNAAVGFRGSRPINPWDLILALEGALLLAGSVSRRMGPAARYGGDAALAVFPFAVRPLSAGHASAGEGTDKFRGEVWLPLWHRPMTAAELAYLFREGRAIWGRRLATSAADMARALVSLGVDRGFDAFLRFGILQRAGKSHLATSLGRWPVRYRPNAELLHELDPFFRAVERALRGADSLPASWTLAARRLQDALLGYVARGGRRRMLALLEAAVDVERRTAFLAPSKRQNLPPLPTLSARWIRAAFDGSWEFLLAAALASLRAPGTPEADLPGPLRAYLGPWKPVAARRWQWLDQPPHRWVWTGRQLFADLVAVLERRLLEAERAAPAAGGPAPTLGLDGHLRLPPQAVLALIDGQVDARRVARLVEVLSHVDARVRGTELTERARRPLPSPRGAVGPDVYAVLKLAFLGRPFTLPDTGARVTVPPDPRILAVLRAGRIWEATQRAAHRLHAAGVPMRHFLRRHGARAPIADDPELGLRLAGSLLVPVRASALVELVVPSTQPSHT